MQHTFFVHFWMLHVASVCTPCCMLLDVVAQSLKPVKLFRQQLPTFLLFLDRRSVAQQCWIRLHSSSNIVGATHPHNAWFTKTYGLYPSHDGPNIAGSCCIRLHTTANTHATTPKIVGATMLELLRPFAISYSFLFTFILTATHFHLALVAASISYFLTAATKLPCCSSNKKMSPLLFISPSRFSFSCTGLPPTFSFSLSFSSKGAHAWSSAKMAIAKKI